MIALGIIATNYSFVYAEELRAHPSAVVFNAVEGQPVGETRSIFIFTALGTAINWQGTINVPWLIPDMQTGVTEGVLKLSVNTAGLLTGIYNANLTLYSAESSTPPVIISVTLIVNPDVPVKTSSWRDGYSSAMSVSVDDSAPSGYDALLANGFSGTYAGWETSPPSFYTQFFNTGMELGSHTVNHPCQSVTDYWLKYVELEPNIQGLINFTPATSRDIVSLVWPCGYTNYREQGIATEYFLSARGYNINQLEDATPDNFMNLKSFNSHEHPPYPPSDLKTVVDAAVAQKKWFNLVLHHYNNDDGAINYAKSKNIWVTSIGSVIKYILQRNGFILTHYLADQDKISFRVSRVPVTPSITKNFENSFNNNDLTTLQIDIDDSRIVDYVTVDGQNTPYKIKDSGGNSELLLNVILKSAGFGVVEIKYLNQSVRDLHISGVTASNKIYDGTTVASLNTSRATLTGVLPGHNVTLISTTVSGTFDNKNAGASKLVSVTGFALTGPDAGKYNLNAQTVSANITAKSIRVIANDIQKRYHEPFIFSGTEYTAEGIIPGDPYPVVFLESQGASETAAVGRYSITLTGTADRNYVPLFVGGIMTVSKAELIARADNRVKVYGSENPVLSISYSGFIKNDNPSVVDMEPVATTTALTTSGAGEYAITLSGGSDDNYDLTLVNGTLNVQKAPVTITADDKTITYGEANPELTLSYSGFIPGEDQGDLDLLPVVATEANTDSDAGSYDIIASGANDLNYQFIYINGIFKKLKADQYIIFENIPEGLKMTQKYAMKATSSSGQKVNFELSDNSKASVNGNILTIHKDGNLIIKAVQEGNINWNPAPPETQSITVLPTFAGISSLFTPNNDGTNDYWYIPDIEQYGKMHLIICNRFGQTVYETSDYKNDWEGTWNGKPLPAASYYYIINSSSKGFVKGVVNIIR